MELMQLEMFVAVVEEGGVRAASERVYRTQPAVSVAIRKLEGEIGTPLFDRSKRYDYRLTEAGEALLRYAKQILSVRKEAVSTLASLVSSRDRRLRVGANESISLHLFPRLAQTFLEKHPGIHIELRCGRSEVLLTDLKDRRLDLVLVSFRPQNRGLESKFVMQDELVLITCADHPLTKKTNVRIQDLGKESILGMEISRPSPWHDKIMDAFERSKAPLNVTLENAPIETIKKMVALGLGVAFVPRISVREELARRELNVVPVEEFHQERSVWLVRSKAAHSAAVKSFTQIAVSSARDAATRDDHLPNETPSPVSVGNTPPKRRP
jgi:DNA-binding transcriptional LysR family regulator